MEAILFKVNRIVTYRGLREIMKVRAKSLATTRSDEYVRGSDSLGP